jgi:predicted permease
MTSWQDIRYACRQLRRAPGFTVVAVLTFALGIGATTAIFSAVYAVVFQPFPFPEPNRVVAVGEQFQGRLAAASPGNFEDWRTHAKSFSELGARRFVSVNVSTGTTPQRLIGTAVTPSYFAVFRIPAALGRTLVSQDANPGRESVVVLSDRLWTRLFARDPAVVGHSMQMDGRIYTIAGVMPPQFDRLGGAEDFWIPAVFTPEQVASHDDHNMTVAGRLAPGVSREQASAELSIIFKQVKTQLPDNKNIFPPAVNDYAAQLIGNSGQRLLVLFAAVALVLLIACGNVAHLLLARGRLRAPEVALRASLGASRGRLVQQFLTESLVLALIGGVLGVVAAYLAVPVLMTIGPAAFSPGAIPRLGQASVNGVVLLFAVGASVLSAILTGIAPALRAANLDLKGSLGDGARTVARPGDALRSTLVAAEVAFAIVLLTGAGLLVRSAIYLQSVNPGFDASSVITARVSLPETGYEDPGRVERAFRDIADRLSQQPAVEYAAVSSSVPMAPGGNNNGLVPEGKQFDPNDFVLGRLGVITGDYFHAFRIPLIAGRTFTAADRRDTQHVMILSATAARRLFPGQNAVDKRVACCEANPDGTTNLKLVVGIVGDVRSDGPQSDPRPDFYLPSQQAPPQTWTWVQRTMTVVARGKVDDPAALTAVVRTVVRDVDPTVPVYDVATMPERLRTTLAEDRFNTTLMLLLGGIGLLLATVGVYGVISFSVAHRRHELAIRMALGARPGEVVRLVVNQGMRPVWLGVAVGVLAAAWLAQALTANLYGVTAHDPATLVAVVVLLISAAIIANVLPARAAARIHPAEMLSS